MLNTKKYTLTYDHAKYTAVPPSCDERPGERALKGVPSFSLGFTEFLKVNLKSLLKLGGQALPEHSGGRGPDMRQSDRQGNQAETHTERYLGSHWNNLYRKFVTAVIQTIVVIYKRL